MISNAMQLAASPATNSLLKLWHESSLNFTIWYAATCARRRSCFCDCRSFLSVITRCKSFGIVEEDLDDLGISFNYCYSSLDIITTTAEAAVTTTTTITRSVVAGFGRHGMPPSASNDTGTAFCLSNWEEADMRRTDDVSLWPWP